MIKVETIVWVVVFTPAGGVRNLYLEIMSSCNLKFPPYLGTSFGNFDEKSVSIELDIIDGH